MLDKIIHRWLRIPYALNVHYFSRPEKPKATILLIHGLGASWQTWTPLEPYLPKDARVIAIDMLGFGNSPKPDWKTYNVHDQAASIVATLRREFINHVDIVIGYSMGSLAAVELAKQYPKLSKSLICAVRQYIIRGSTKKSIIQRRFYVRFMNFSIVIRAVRNAFYNSPIDITFGLTRDLRLMRLPLSRF